MCVFVGWYHLQQALTRVQKERDVLSDEIEAYKERAENSQSMVLKAVREREQIQTELDVVKERWEKANTIHQKLQVRHSLKKPLVNLMTIFTYFIFRSNATKLTPKSIFSKRNWTKLCTLVKS